MYKKLIIKQVDFYLKFIKIKNLDKVILLESELQPKYDILVPEARI